MRGRVGGALVVAVALMGAVACGEDPPPPAAAPEAVTPVAVEPIAEAPAEGEESLRARIAELEAELATCRGELPEGVDADDRPTANAEDADGAGEAEAEDTPAERRAAARTERRDRSLLGTLLGDEDPPRRRASEHDPEVIQVPNPAAILLGGE